MQQLWKAKLLLFYGHNWNDWIGSVKEIILVTLICCIIFQSLFKDSISMSMPTVCFLIQSDSNSLPAECFPLTLDLKTFFT